VADPRGGEGAIAPAPRLGPKNNFIARPKNTHICKPAFACQNVLKLTYLQQSRISKFSGEGPPDPPLQGEGKEEEGREDREGKEKGRREGKDREGRGGTGRDRGAREGGRERRNGGWGGEGRGARHGLPLETSSGSAPADKEGRSGLPSELGFAPAPRESIRRPYTFERGKSRRTDLYHGHYVNEIVTYTGRPRNKRYSGNTIRTGTRNATGTRNTGFHVL